LCRYRVKPIIEIAQTDYEVDFEADYEADYEESLFSQIVRFQNIDLLLQRTVFTQVLCCLGSP